MKIEEILETQDIEMLQKLIDDGKDLSKVELFNLLENEKKINIRFVTLLIENGINIHILDSYYGKTYLMLASEKGYLKIVRSLLNQGCNVNFEIPSSDYIDIQEDIYQDYTALMFAIENNHHDIVMELILDGADVNYELWTISMSILTLAVLKGNKSIIKLLLDAGSNIFDEKVFSGNDNGKLILEKILKKGNEGILNIFKGNEDVRKCIYANAYKNGNEEIQNIFKEKKKEISKPQTLVKLLENFTIETPIKYTTHRWEASCESCKTKSFDEFIADVKAQWDNLKSELEKLSPNLYKKIETFIFSNDKNATPWCDESQINLGWSNTDGLKEHCEHDGKPFNLVLKEPLHINDETITTFGEVIKIFKEKIEVRNDSDMLKQIFINFRKQLRKANIKTKLSSSIDGVDFYTDVEKFIGSLNLIASGIIAKKQDDDIVDIYVKKPESDYIEIHIVHNNSFSNRTSKEMLKEIDSGDWIGIKENLTNLCDWSIEDSYNDEAYRVNYLKSSNLKDIEGLNQKPDGFTHILRFYR